MNVLINNWYLIVLGIIFLVLLAIYVINFTKLPVKDKNSKILRFLLGVVFAAEKEFGGKTGQLKLADVYGKFVIAYPFIKNFISFETFSKWVDMALTEMKKLIETNPAMKDYVNNPKSE